jgi:glycosyltransferase involved in cell wall biosynthesis
VSGEIAGHLIKRVPSARTKIEVVYAGVGDPPRVTRGANEIRSELDLTDERLVVTVARLAPQKSVDVLLRALARLPDAVVLAVVGDGPLRRELVDLAGSLGVSERVRWLGWRTDAPDYVAAADVFALSSIWEAVALVVQEAVLLGTPVVSTAVGGIPELIADGESGLLVPPNDPGALAAALEDVLKSPDLRRDLVENARKAYDERFSATTLMSRLGSIYREVARAD